MTTQNIINTQLSGATGSGNFVGSTSPTIVTPLISYANNGSIKDTNGNQILLFTVESSAVNYVTITNNTTGNTPQIAAVGTDTNITLRLLGQGTGGVLLTGTTTNDDAPARYVGEFISSVIASGSSTTMTSNASTDLTSINLTAGDWDTWGNITWLTLGTVPTSIDGWISSASATLPDPSLRVQLAISGLGANSGFTVPMKRFSLNTTTTIYISGNLTNTSGNGTACGGIYARRVR